MRYLQIHSHTTFNEHGIFLTLAFGFRVPRKYSFSEKKNDGWNLIEFLEIVFNGNVNG